MIGRDPRIMDKGNPARDRTLEYRKYFRKIYILNNADKNKKVKNIEVCGLGSNSFKFVISGILKGSTILKKERRVVLTVADPFLSGIIGVILSKTYKVPLIVQVHGEFINNRKWINQRPFVNRILHAIGIITLRRADAVRVVSEKIKSELLKYGLPKDKIKVIPVFVTGKFRCAKKENRRHLNLITVARLEKEKNIEMLLNAVSLLSDEARSKIKVKIIGDGTLRHKLERMAENKGIKEIVEFKGYVPHDKLCKEYNSSDLYVQTSLHESYGLSVAEAVLSCLPVISTPTGLAQKLVESYGIGELVNNEKELAKVIENMATRPNSIMKYHQKMLKARKDLLEHNKSPLEELMEFYHAQSKKNTHQLVIITQAVDKNDPVLAFFIDWIKEFSKYFEKVHVITLNLGKVDLPENVIVHEIRGKGRVSKALHLLNTALKICQKNNKTIFFAHMCPEYALVAAVPAKLHKSPLFLWYAHGATPLPLRLAEKVVQNIFTPTSESIHLKSSKIIVVGHGINTQKFKKKKSITSLKKERIFFPGRYSPLKRQKEFLEYLPKNAPVTVTFAGPILNQKYYERLNQISSRKNLSVVFKGPISYNCMCDEYNNSILVINFSKKTHSLDKTILEAMACERPVLSTLVTYKKILKEKELIEKCYIDNPREVWNKIEFFLKNKEEAERIGKKLRSTIIIQHSVFSLIKKISKIMLEE